MESAQSRVLILIVAYNAATTIEHVLTRIPRQILRTYQCEVLIIDDESADDTFEIATHFRESNPEMSLTVLRNPRNQMYGGNQKIGYEYAIRRGFDCVVLLHGDGQYAPEVIDTLIQPVVEGRVDAVMGARTMVPGSALAGGMPLYKYVGNRILSFTQNKLLGTRLSEFHSGYRCYSVPFLGQLPFRFNTNDFHFDTQIIIQIVLSGGRIVEVPIPTYYGNEICHVNGLAYAGNVVRTTLQSRMQSLGIMYRREYDIPRRQERYPLKLGYDSSHTLALEKVPHGACVLEIGSGSGAFARHLKARGCRVTGLDQIAREDDGDVFDEYIQSDLNSAPLTCAPDAFDVILLLDVIEHLDLAAQRRLLDTIRNKSAAGKPLLVLSTPNIAFLLIRLALLFGRFAYGPRGILDFTHRYLYTFNSLSHELQQAGYQIETVEGVPAPFPAALGDNLLSRVLLALNKAGIRLLRGVFSYQIMMTARPTSTVNQLLQETEGETAYLLAERRRRDNGP